MKFSPPAAVSVTNIRLPADRIGTSTFQNLRSSVRFLLLTLETLRQTWESNGEARQARRSTRKILCRDCAPPKSCSQIGLEENALSTRVLGHRIGGKMHRNIFAVFVGVVYWARYVRASLAAKLRAPGLGAESSKLASRLHRLSRHKALDGVLQQKTTQTGVMHPQVRFQRKSCALVLLVQSWCIILCVLKRKLIVAAFTIPFRPF